MPVARGNALAAGAQRHTATYNSCCCCQRISFCFADKGLNVTRMLVGTFVSSLDMAGVSISVMHATDSICTLLDAPTEAPAWPRSIARPQIKGLAPLSEHSTMAAREALDLAPVTEPGRTSAECHLLIRVLQCCAKACIAAEAELTRQDKLAGDGDCGQTIKQGAEGIIAALPRLRLEDLGATASQLASAAGKTMGGTSGALYDLFFTAGGVPLKGIHTDAATPATWAEALTCGVDAVKKYGRASVGDRSMVDALEPAARAAMQAAGASPPWVLPTTVLSKDILLCKSHA
ncbi:MAG: DAK2 domain-containing protein [Akkermansiaceae bacterium]|nr:DAK2 domain-containing protein [Akkermansiaceae bacterium]